MKLCELRFCRVRWNLYDITVKPREAHYNPGVRIQNPHKHSLWL